jgi:hypothetical protein
VKSLLSDQGFIIMHHDDKKYFSVRMHIERIVVSSPARWCIFYFLDMLYIFCCSLSALNYCNSCWAGRQATSRVAGGESVKRYILRTGMHVFLYIRWMVFRNGPLCKITGLYKCECKARFEVLTLVVETSNCLGCDAHVSKWLPVLWRSLLLSFLGYKQPVAM